jgi:hypothetical protein
MVQGDSGAAAKLGSDAVTRNGTGQHSAHSSPQKIAVTTDSVGNDVNGHFDDPMMRPAVHVPGGSYMHGAGTSVGVFSPFSSVHNTCMSYIPLQSDYHEYHIADVAGSLEPGVKHVEDVRGSPLILKRHEILKE